LLNNIGWQPDAVGVRRIVLLCCRCLVVATPAMDMSVGAVKKQSFPRALSEAFGHQSYVLLVLVFSTCGFHIAFITVHLPPLSG